MKEQSRIRRETCVVSLKPNLYPDVKKALSTVISFTDYRKIAISVTSAASVKQVYFSVSRSQLLTYSLMNWCGVLIWYGISWCGDDRF